MQAILRDRGEEADVLFTRLAVTPQPITDLGLPTAPPKATDRRRFDGQETVQAEAIPPDVLADIIRQAITDRTDEKALHRVLDEEERMKAALAARVARI